MLVRLSGLGSVWACSGLLGLLGCSESSPPVAPRAPVYASPIDAAIALGTTPVALDAREVPRLLRAAPGAIAAGATASDQARAHVRRLAAAWGVRGEALPQLETAGEIPVLGGTVVRLRQVIDGIPLETGELRVLVRASGELLAVSGSLVGTDARRDTTRRAVVVADGATAVARAIGHTHATAFDRAALRAAPNQQFAGRTSTVAVASSRAVRVWHAKDDGALIEAWRVEAYSSSGATRDAAFRTVLAADDGRVLEHRTLVRDGAHDYRVFADPAGDRRPHVAPVADFAPHPTGVPDASFPAPVLPSLVTVDGLNHPTGQASPDPWLPVGAADTQGNNVDAYADLVEPDGFSSGDFRATVTAPGRFDRTYDPALSPLASPGQQMAGITSLFYSINWLHDFWYDAGFVEAAGNAQAANFGRGGAEGDVLLAEAQDEALAGTRNNANMSTPDDGLSPRMQVYLWTGGDERSLAVSPGTRTPNTNVAAFGPQSFDVTGEIVLAVDGAGAPSDACGPLGATVAGKIVLVDDGGCSPETKALAIQTAGGLGMIYSSSIPGPTIPRLFDDDTVSDAITIGSLAVFATEGEAIEADVLAGAHTATLHRVAQPELDGSLDATLVAHEFGHYLHLRLSPCANSACFAMSEGWGDFLALLVTVRPDDDLQAIFPFGGYVTQAFTSDPGYFGIRRAPYSANPASNALGFRHMRQSEPLPTTFPIQEFGSNAEVHNAGEVWTSALWQGYVALQNAGTSFETVHATMAKYVVAGLAMTPADATPTEARDALLVAAAANSPTDAALLAEAFAQRGFGSCARSAERTSFTFDDIVDSDTLSGNAVLGSITLDDTIVRCDSDGTLDAGETARVTLPIANGGFEPLTDITVTLTTTTPGATVMSAPFTLASLAPYATTTATFDLALDERAGIQGAFALEVVASNGCAPKVVASKIIRLNLDDVPASNATDHFDTTASIWTRYQDIAQPTTVWAFDRRTALDGFWHGANSDTSTDESVVSPLLQADATTPVTISFTHRFAFELGEFDGGVIEISTDDGTTWLDVAGLTSVPYTGTISEHFGNSLGGRDGFVDQNPAYPGTDTVMLDFGTQLAGASFRLRFRIGTDYFGNAEGWEIDDIVTTGIGRPFASVVDDPGVCDDVEPMPEEPTPVEDDGGCCDAGPLRPGNALLALVLAFVAGRRRRR